MRRTHAPTVFLLLIVASACITAPRLAHAAQSIELSNATWTVEVAPATLAVTAKPRGKAPIELSAPQEGFGPMGKIAHAETEASWELKGCSVRVRLTEDALSVSFRSGSGGEITWPVVGRDPAILAYVLPLDEGSYVPVDNAEWLSFLAASSPMSTTEGLSMPFLGLDCGEYSVSYILTNPFHNALTFYPQGKRISARLRHEFTARGSDEYGVTIRLGPRSPIEPALQYRRWLIERGQFVSLQDKITQVPGVEKLLGAAHVYLWGNSLLSRHDVQHWQHFAGMLLAWIMHEG